MLFDEPTSALDPITEARVTQAILNQHPEATVIASVHRLHLLPHFDRIVLMAEGRVVDHGPLDALLERQPLLRDMWSKSPLRLIAG
jgi:ATP-binding cassette subfamily B protein